MSTDQTSTSSRTALLALAWDACPKEKRQLALKGYGRYYGDAFKVECPTVTCCIFMAKLSFRRRLPLLLCPLAIACRKRTCCRFEAAANVTHPQLAALSSSWRTSSAAVGQNFRMKRLISRAVDHHQCKQYRQVKDRGLQKMTCSHLRVRGNGREVHRPHAQAEA